MQGILANLTDWQWVVAVAAVCVAVHVVMHRIIHAQRFLHPQIVVDQPSGRSLFCLPHLMR